MLHFLFSFKGRVNRAKFWIYYLVVCFVGSGMGFASITAKQLLGKAAATSHDSGTLPLPWPFGWSWSPLDILMAAFFVLFFYSLLAVIVKRFHDRGKSAWWLVFFYGVPGTSFAGLLLAGYSPSTASPQMHMIQLGLFIVNSIIIWWYLIELLFLPGTRSENRFGPDPRAKAERIDRPQGGA